MEVLLVLGDVRSTTLQALDAFKGVKVVKIDLKTFKEIYDKAEDEAKRKFPGAFDDSQSESTQKAMDHMAAGVNRALLFKLPRGVTLNHVKAVVATNRDWWPLDVRLNGVPWYA